MSEHDAEDAWESLPEADADEIDRIIAALNVLMDQAKSPTVLEILEDACCDLAELVDVDDDEDDGDLADAA